jgi:uncharacterized protein (TIGR00369 family)
MTIFKPRDPDFQSRCRTAFSGQPFMDFIGAELVHLSPGHCHIEVPHRRELLQQHGYFHGGITATIADNAAGIAAVTLFDAQSEPLTVEFKVNLIAPARGDRLIARGRVIKPGRTLSICQAEVFGVSDGEEILVATGLVTIMRLEGMSDRVAS